MDLFEKRLADDLNGDLWLCFEKRDEIVKHLLSQVILEVYVDEDEGQGLEDDGGKLVSVL